MSEGVKWLITFIVLFFSFAGVVGGLIWIASGTPQTHAYTLPHAEKVIAVQSIDLKPMPGQPIKKVVVDFKTFQEYTRGTVYVMVDGIEPGDFSTCTLRLGFYTIVNGTVWVSYVVVENAPLDYTLIVNGTTVIVEKRG
ncbi:protein of unknown function (plasmid) [Thermococcus nautili]|uniref:hypothetical protein n=1 Tax=Thermococcus nautili TaxID=195522 RepID=UPI0025553B9F|nr:hypothetical protein [Thermococcus nautili]CAI1494218.1 protein of unknown function [Thermococcus nautili]